MTFQLTGTDAMNSVLNRIASEGQCQRQSFSPYGGSSTALARTPGFNGERCDPLTGTTHLGNGYRAYNPTLIRFHCPDSMSPFGAGGINPYAYCAGDPINRSDPSGHMSAQAGVGIGLGVLGLALGAASFGVSIAAKVAVVASVAAISTGIASIATENSNPEASAALGWASMGLGIAGAATGIFSAAKGIRTSELSKRLQKIKTEEKSGWGAGQAAKKMAKEDVVLATDMLPDEMLMKIGSFLDEESLFSLSQTNRRWLEVTSEVRLKRPEYLMNNVLNTPFVMNKKQDKYFYSLHPDRQTIIRLRYQSFITCRKNPSNETVTAWMDVSNQSVKSYNKFTGSSKVSHSILRKDTRRSFGVNFL
ncbi:RHS repeat-associated core domain [Serratia quinivorans]|uniref:RHS repeat-associated core domain-containing protein n=1 Tax=Serratia quinivorans TaxID=137545 RepID=A0ABV3UJX0_9GAMM|nr:RHS repeat-associated core domain-containing protein [Serratia quinivorans]CAI1564307.1 RHS repeat-associated core domain [Serratia quinivorans]CAI1698993.1 RHS repeat-associated core domain [Serratia quinivorans]